jgi:UDP-N-acetylglucosamine--N-acetylmuramyl-(pentapeptide) pyrophosphoryl-undecaprenol N-acetylglucosamine transferase
VHDRPSAQQRSKPATVPERDSTVALCYVGQSGNIEEELARRAGIPFRTIESGQIRGRAPWEIARSLGQMARGARQAAKVIQEFRPDVALVTGGYVAAPVAWATWQARPRVPILIFLPDLTPGLAIKWTSRIAARVAVSLPEVSHHFPGKAVVTGYPVRPELQAADRDEARKAFGLQGNLPVLLVFGGSRGSVSINRALLSALPELLPYCQVIHISGQADWPWVDEHFAPGQSPNKERYHLFPYLNEEMVWALAAADLVVARAGASVLGEFPAVRLPSILVPYPHAGKHQQVNAEYLAQRGAALVLTDEELPLRLASMILGLLAAPNRLAAMSQAAAGLARPDAAGNIIRELLQLGGQQFDPGRPAYAGAQG